MRSFVFYALKNSLRHAIQHGTSDCLRRSRWWCVRVRCGLSASR